MEREAYLEMAAVEARHWWFRGRRRILAAVIRQLNLKPDARILELGSGTGGNLLLLSRFGQVTAVEMDDAARAISVTKTSKAEVLAGALPYNLQLGDRKFDLICLFDVLEHVADDEAALAAARTHLGPGGTVVITVPAYAALFGPHDVALHHQRRYGRAELQRKLCDAGFAVRRLSFANAGLLPLAFLLRWLDKVLRRPAASGAKIPPSPLNQIFAAIFGAEAWVLRWVDLPFGLSLLAVVTAAD